MMRIFLRENVRWRTTLVFMVAVLVVASLQMVTIFHGQAYRHRHDGLSNRATSDFVFLATLSPMMSSWSSSLESSSVEDDAAPTDKELYPLAENSKFTITQQQRSVHVIHRLSRFSGSGHGVARASHFVVSSIGILGMFSAIVGALIGPWLADANDDSSDEDRFAYWVRDDEDDEDEERVCGFAREEKYGLYRILDVPC